VLTGEHFSSLGDEQTSASNASVANTETVLIHSREDVAEISASSACQVSRHSGDVATSNDLEEARVKEILSDSKMREILMDSRIQQLMTHLRNDPDKGQM